MNTRISFARGVSIMLLLLLAMISCDRLANQKQDAFIPEDYNFTPSNISYGASINNGIRPRTFTEKTSLTGNEEVYSQAGGIEEKFTVSTMKSYTLSSNENGEVVNTGNGDPTLSTPTDRNYYYDSVNNRVWFWNGEEWELVGNGQTGSGDPGPGTPTAPPYYLNTDTNELWYWDGTEWVKVSGGEGDDNFATANSVGNGLNRIHDIRGGVAIIKTAGNARSQLTVSGSFGLGARLLSVDDATGRAGNVIASSSQSGIVWRDDSTRMEMVNEVASRAAIIASTNTNTSTSNSMRVTPYRIEFATTAVNNSTAVNGQVPILYDASSGAWEWGTISGGGGPVTWASITGKPAGFADDVDNDVFLSSIGDANGTGNEATYPFIMSNSDQEDLVLRSDDFLDYTYANTAGGIVTQTNLDTTELRSWIENDVITNTGGGTPITYQTLTNGNLTANVMKEGNDIASLNVNSGIYDMAIPSGMETHQIVFEGNNSTVSGTSFIVDIDNSANGRGRYYNVQLYARSNGTMQNLFSNGNVPDQDITGNVTRLTIPDASLYGSSGFRIVLN